MDKAAAWLKRTLEFDFEDETLLRRALTHRSAQSAHNERLEFLGDAVLETVVSDALYRLRPNANEGELSRLRAALVNDNTLAALATDLRLGEHLMLGPGEKKAGGHRRASILADALEALFGAVYLDAGYSAASMVIHKLLAHRLEHLPDADDLRDPKTRLQEVLQADGRPLPNYEVVDVSGKAHRQRFEVACHVNGEDAASSGTGRSRRDAEQEAARNMLERLQRGGGQ